MNYVFISPSFPKTYYQFCACLKRKGVRVLSIGDTPYEELSEEVKNSVCEYYCVSSMENYDEMIKAIGYFIFRYGHIDWLESQNEYWLEQDARLRTDFHITTGIQNNHIADIKCKSQMKKFYEKACVKTARYHMVSTLEKGEAFIQEVGYPVVVKPDNGVGAAKTYKISSHEELESFYQEDKQTPYIMEEFVDGYIVSYDGIANMNKDILFETSHVFNEQIMDVVNNETSISYYSLREIPSDLKEAGRRCVKEFYTAGRCFHMEFFRLREDKEGLGKKGELIGLEVNHRMPGGYTPDMMNYANNINVYQIYADMVVDGYSHYETKRPYYCVYCGRRDKINYKYTHEEVISRYQFDLVMCERMPDILSDAMGNMNYTARFTNKEDVEIFISYVLESR